MSARAERIDDAASSSTFWPTIRPSAPWFIEAEMSR
jgi:hypothetical protein